MIDIFNNTLDDIESLNFVDDTLSSNTSSYTLPDFNTMLKNNGIDTSRFSNLGIFDDSTEINSSTFNTRMDQLNSIEIPTKKDYSMQYSKEPSQEGKFALAKRIGSKLNYNESDTEIANYFAGIESGGDYNARNKESSAFGKYQVVKSTLVEKARDLGISVKEARTPEGQEMVMHSLLSDYKDRLKEFDLPVTKENMFVLHNLGQTGGIRVLKGNYSGSDIEAMRRNVSSGDRKLPPKELVKAYANKYNINIFPKES